MKSAHRRNRAWLLANAMVVAERLGQRTKGTGLRIRRPARATLSNTDGWYCVIGNLGPKKLKLEIYLDRFSGYPDRKLYACLSSEIRTHMIAVTDRVSRKFWPIRTVTPEDLADQEAAALAKRLKRSEFGVPILEKYQGGRTFYGIYDSTRPNGAKVHHHFCQMAVSFFEDVARSLPHTKTKYEQIDIYPQYENRKLITAHLQRERSRYLSTQCKIRDDYKCRVCGFRFDKAYGGLGTGFAEAHHKIPLGQLRDRVRTRIEDLVTVCANCHRMLHHMKGQRNDLDKLRRIVLNARA